MYLRETLASLTKVWHIVFIQPLRATIELQDRKSVLTLKCWLERAPVPLRDMASFGMKNMALMAMDVTCMGVLLGVSAVTVAVGSHRKLVKSLSSEHLPHTSSEVQTADTKTPHIIKDTTTTHPETSQTLCSSDQAKPEVSGSSTVGHGLREGRKVLPPIPDPATEAEMTASLHSNTKVLPGGSGEGQIKLEYTLMNEYNMLHKQKLPGIYVIPSALSPLIWNGVLFLRQGLYQDAVFRFNLNIPEAYPNADCPRVFFEFPVFHPAVDPKTGELDVKREFKKWRRGTNFLWQVLMYVRRVFFKIDPKCSWNEEAAELYEHNMEEYRKKVETTVRSSKDVLYNPIESKDPHMIRFSPWEPSIHEEAKTDMLTRKKNRSDLEPEPHKRNGLSWVSPGTTQIFSSDESTSSLS